MIQEILNYINAHPFISIIITVIIIIAIHKFFDSRLKKKNGEKKQEEELVQQDETPIPIVKQPATEDVLEKIKKELGVENEEENKDIVETTHNQVTKLGKDIEQLMSKYHDKLRESKEKITNEEREIYEKAQIMINRRNRLEKARRQVEKSLNLTKTS